LLLDYFLTARASSSESKRLLHPALDRHPVSRLAKDAVGARQVRGDAVAHTYLQSAEHDGDQAKVLTSARCLHDDSPAGACPADHVEVVACLRRRVWVDGLYQLLEDHQGGQATHAVAVERKQAEFAARYGDARQVAEVGGL
jgi:hypothetical protein